MTYTDIYDFSGGNCDENTYQFSPLLIVILVICTVAIILTAIIVPLTNNSNVPEIVSQPMQSSQPEVVNQPEQSSQSEQSNPEPSNDPEPFTNDLPYQLNNKSVSLSPDMDYSELLQTMSLDDDVVKQHNQYVNDRNKITSTASFVPSRSDNQDIVTTWGLSKPTYVAIDPSARNVPSQNPEQGSKPVRLQWK